MHHQPRRLVQHINLRILVDHLQVHGLWRKGLALRCGTQFQLQCIACFELGSLLVRLHAVDTNATGVYELLQVIAGKLRSHLHQHFIQALAMQVKIDAELAQLHTSGEEIFALILISRLHKGARYNGIGVFQESFYHVERQIIGGLLGAFGSGSGLIGRLLDHP